MVEGESLNYKVGVVFPLVHQTALSWGANPMTKGSKCPTPLPTQFYESMCEECNGHCFLHDKCRHKFTGNDLEHVEEVYVDKHTARVWIIPMMPQRISYSMHFMASYCLPHTHTFTHTSTHKHIHTQVHPHTSTSTHTHLHTLSDELTLHHI